MSSSTVDENAFRSPETNPTSKETVPKGIRIAIPIILLCLMIIARFIPSFWENGPSMTWAIGAFGPMLSCLLAVLWWFLLSGASWKEKGSGFGLLVLCLVVCSLLLHPSLAGLSVVITIPLGIAGFTLGLVVMSKSDTFRRLAVASLCCLIFAGPTIMLRNKGAWGNFSFDLEPRWVPSAEEQFLASRKEKSNAESEQIAELGPSEAFPDAEWPGFRGPNRDGVQRGVVFDVDWKANPPKEVWRIKVGPAWSSFAVAGNYLFTQEQRGPEEAIVCYAADSGSELWSSTVESRFEEPLGGLGPRATPSIAGDKVVALGAEGWLRCLEAATGKELWQIDLRKEANCAIPMWGFSCSPFCTEDIAIVHSGASGDKGIMAFRLKNGELAWSAAAGKMSYGSLQSVPLLGQDWIGLLSEKGAEFFDPADGTSTFLYEWPHSGYRALQPQMVAKDQFLVPTGQGTGTQLVRIQKNGDNYEGEEVWTNWRFRPDYNDVFVHQDNIYGFDGQIFASIRLEDGKQNWKGGRYGKGQAVLLADSNAILVLSEEGEMILLSATPEDHVELYKQKVLPSRTWNHPVIVGDRLYVRDAEEAACYALPVAAMPNTPDESEAPEPEAGAGEPSN